MKSGPMKRTTMESVPRKERNLYHIKPHLRSNKLNVSLFKIYVFIGNQLSHKPLCIGNS